QPATHLPARAASSAAATTWRTSWRREATSTSEKPPRAKPRRREGRRSSKRADGVIGSGVGAGAGEDLVDRGGLVALLDVFVAEPALDAQVPPGHRVVVGGGHLDDPVVLHVQLEVAADPAVR